MRIWISERFEVYARGLLLAAMVLTPAFFLKSTAGIFAIAKLTLLWSLMVLCLAIWAVWRLNGGSALPRSLLLRFGAAFVALAALATAFSPYRLTALVGHYYVYGGLVSLQLFLVVAFVVFALYWSRPYSLEELCRGGAIAAFVVTGYQLLQEAGLDWHTWSLRGRTAPWEGGSLGNPNFTGGFLGATLPFALYLTVNSKKESTRRLYLGLTLLQLCALWLTASRGGLAAGLAAGAIFAAPHLRDIPAGIKRGAGIAAAVLLVVVAIAAVRVSGNPVPQGVEPTILGISVSPNNLVDVRVDFWRAAVGIIKDHPILGTGPDTYYANYTSHRPPENGADPNLQLENNPHNIFLAHGVGSGLLGLAAYLLAMAYAFRLAFRRVRQSKDPKERLLLVTFAAVLGGYATQGFVSIDHVPLAMLGWVCFAAIAVLAEPEAQAARQALEASTRVGPSIQGQQRPRQRRLTMPVAAVSLGALLLLSIGARFVNADVRSETAKSSSNLNQRFLLLRQAFRLNPAEAEYHYVAGTTLHQLGASRLVQGQGLQRTFEEARLQYLEALKRRPRSIVYLVALAQLDSSWGGLIDKQHFITAGESWRRAIGLDPHNYRWHFHYSEMLGASAVADGNNRALRLAQIEELRTSIGIYRNQPQAWTRLVEAFRAIGDTAQADATGKEFFGETPSSANLQGSADPPAAPAAPATAPSAAPPAAGLAIAFTVPAVLGIAALRGLMVATRRREGAKQSKKKREVAPALLHELLGAAGIWSLATAIPQMGVVLGAGLAEGELKELLVHIVPGGAALALGILHSSLPFRGGRPEGDLLKILPFVTFVTSLVAIVVHLAELFSGNGVGPAAGVLLHVTPLLAIFVLVSASIARPAGSAPAAPARGEAKESVDIV